MDKLEWEDLIEAVIGLIDTWENKRKKNKKIKIIVQLEYHKIEVNFLNLRNNENLKSFKFLRTETQDKAILTFNKTYRFIKNSHNIKIGG